MPGKIILIFWHHPDLQGSTFPIQQMLLHQMLKIQMCLAHFIGCFHLKTTVPYRSYVKGLSIVIDCLGKDIFDFFSPLSDVHLFFLCFWQEIKLLNNKKMWVIITRHISCFNFIYFEYIQIYYFLENTSKP